LLTGLKEYSKEGQFIAEHGDEAFASTFDQAYGKVKADHP
jgi:hypothetical protein